MSLDDILNRTDVPEDVKEELRSIMSIRGSAQDPLEESERKYRRLFESAQDGILILDAESGMIVDVNPFLTELLGYSAEEFRKKAVWDLGFFQDIIPNQERFAQLQHQGYVRYEHLPLETIDGRNIDVEFVSNVYSVNGHNVIQFNIRDITESRRVTEELRLKTMLLEAQLETSIDGILIVDENGRTILYNRRFKELWNIPQHVLDIRDDEEMIGYVLHQLKDSTEFTARVAYLYQHPDETSREEITFLDGRCFDRYSAPLSDLKGKFQGRIWYFRDITERKDAERALLRQERLGAVGEVAAGVAHDFNNVLQIIFGNLELAMIQQLPADAREYLEIVKKSSIDAAARINQLQRFAGRRVIGMGYGIVNMNSVVDDAVSQSRHLWKDESEKQGLRIDIKTSCADDLTVLGNDAELRSVLYNLLKNGIQAMPAGGAIIIETRREDDEMYLTVTDTGIGMDDSIKDRVFQPFFTTKGYEQGRGLGMSSVLSIVTEHNGKVYVKRTAPGEGTSIEVCLPCYIDKSILEEKPESGYAGHARVLWVDDEEQIRMIGKGLLEKLGHQADCASSGPEALEQLANGEYDLMITDVGMRGMSGWQLAERVKETYPGIRIAIVTGWGGEEVTDEQRTRYGVGYILGKPVLKDQLERMVCEVMQLKEG